MSVEVEYFGPSAPDPGIYDYWFDTSDNVRKSWDGARWVEHIDDLLYCPKCGACGESGCCTPSLCCCLCGNEYKKDYKDLLDEHETFLSLLKRVIVKDESVMQDIINIIGKYM